MPESSIYTCHGPSAWPEAPTRFSFSSLAAIEVCPLQWQLLNARYPGLARFPARPHPAAVEGDIVHQILDLLFKSLALVGLPEIGTTEFRKEVARLSIRVAVEELIAKHEARLASHPRGAGFRLRVGAQQLVNQIIRLFRAEYSRAVPEPTSSGHEHPVKAPKEPSRAELCNLLNSRGAVSELRLEHPSLPFVGVIDLVRMTDKGAVILDFKTGKDRPSHQDQVQIYAILWWRKTGRRPARTEVRYPAGVEAFSVNEEDLAADELKLGQRIDQVAGTLSAPAATARAGDQCRYCDVRQFCDLHWRRSLEVLSSGGTKPHSPIDIELTVDGQPSRNGFSATSGDGSTWSVVHATDGPKVHGPFNGGEVLRILSGRRVDSAGTIELMPWSEVFHR